MTKLISHSKYINDAHSFCRRWNNNIYSAVSSRINILKTDEWHKFGRKKKRRK